MMLSTSTTAIAAPITAGNIVLTRAAGGPNGDRSAALSGSGVAAKVFLDEYTTAGAFVQSIPVNSVVDATPGNQRALTFSGTQNLEGHITLSGDGRYMVFAGYNQGDTATAGTNGAAATTVERVIGRLDLGTGVVDTTTALVDAASQQSVRTAYSTNGTDFWIAGNGGNNVTVNAVPNITTTGVHYAQFGVNTGGNTLSTQLNTTALTGNSRYVLGFNGKLFVSSASTSGLTSPQRGINVMTGGLATTTGQTLSSLPGFLTATADSPDDFWFLNGKTAYLADQRTNGNANAGIQKWVFDDNTAQWNFAYTINSGITNVAGTATGVHGLTGMINGLGQAVLFGTTIDGTGANQTKFFSVTDTGALSMATILATSATNSAFRGIEIALPAPTIPEPGTVVLLALGSLAACTLLRRRSIG